MIKLACFSTYFTMECVVRGQHHFALFQYILYYGMCSEGAASFWLVSVHTLLWNV